MVRLRSVRTVLFVSNLFPRPDAPRNGMFNLSFVGAMQAQLALAGGAVNVLVPVPEWRPWRWRLIRRWAPPAEVTAIVGKHLRVQYVPCFYLPLIGRSLSFLWYRFAFCRVMNFTRGSDAVVASWLYPDALAAVWLASRLGKPCWIRLHGSDRFHLDSPIRGRLCRRVLSNAAGVLVNADFMKNELVRRGIQDACISVVPNGVDRTVFHPDQNQTRDTGIILWVGNMVAIKRPDLALRAFAGLTRIHADGYPTPAGTRLQLVMVGAGPMRRRLERLARQLAIENQVTFSGCLSRGEVASWMRRSGLLLLTSRSEGMPNVVIEALACGTPVVATSVGDVPEIVVDDVNGFVVRANDETLPDDVTQALMKALHASWDRNAVQASVAVHDWPRAAECVLSIISPENAD